MPLSVPIHTEPFASSERQFTLPGGKPSMLLYWAQVPFEIELRPFAVPNHIVPSELSRIQVTALEVSVLPAVKVVNLPSLNLLRPRLVLPAQTVPSRLR